MTQYEKTDATQRPLRICRSAGRHKVVLATKVGFDRHGKGQGLKKEQIEYWIDEEMQILNNA